LRDSAVWQVPEGAAVSWVRMGEGNVGIDDYVHNYESLCPGKALSLESIIFGPRVFPYRDPGFWDGYRTTPAWQFQRFVALSERGKAVPAEPWEKADEAQRQREALDASLAHLKKVLKG